MNIESVRKTVTIWNKNGIEMEQKWNRNGIEWNRMLVILPIQIWNRMEQNGIEFLFCDTGDKLF